MTCREDWPLSLLGSTHEAEQHLGFGGDDAVDFGDGFYFAGVAPGVHHFGFHDDLIARHDDPAEFGPVDAVEQRKLAWRSVVGFGEVVQH